MTELLISLIHGAITDAIKSGFLKIKEHIKTEAFIREITDWCNEFIKQHEDTVVSGSDFYEYMKNYNVIPNLFNFVFHPIDESEDSFTNRMVIIAIEKCAENNHFRPDDIRAVRELISGIFERIKAFCESNVNHNDTALLYYLKQSNAKIDNVSTNVDRVLNTLDHKKEISFPKIYDMPDNMIERKFLDYKKLQSMFLFSEKPENMLEVCERDRHIVILGEAGCGKSIALKQLSAMAYHAGYFVMFKALNHYTNETIEQLISIEYPHLDNLDNYKLFLIFDAYDEIQTKNQKDFARILSNYSLHNPNVIIVVSSRNNFYHFADDDGSGGTLEKYAEYGVAPIRTPEINEYLLKNGVHNVEGFHNEINRKSLNSLIFIPFYLSKLIILFKDEGCLPQKSSLMEKIIESRFDKDISKYVNTEDLQESHQEIKYCLEKLAFAMQCMHLIEIPESDYQLLINDKNQRILLKYSGVFTKSEDDKYAFEHNNFREYLVARYINRMDIEGIKGLLCNSEGKIHNSWINVLSYLILIRENKDLMELLIDKNSETVVKFEESRVEENLRASIVKRILDSHAEKNTWLSFGINSSDELATFGQSPILCDYLIDRIESSKTFREQANAIFVLGEFSALFGREEKVRDTLYNCIKSDDVRNHEKAYALEAISQLGLHTDEITSFVVEQLSRSDDSFLTKHTLKYLNKQQNLDGYVDIYIDAYNNSIKHRGNSYSIDYEVFEGFTMMKSTYALCKIFRTISANHVPFSFESDNYDLIVNNAIDAFSKEKKDDLFYTLTDVLVESQIYNHKLFESCFKFFEQTGAVLSVFILLTDKFAKKKDYSITPTIESIMNENCYSYILNAYKNDPSKYQEIIIHLAYRLPEDDDNYIKISDCLLENNITLTKKKPYMDYEKARAHGRQILFDAYFSKEKYCKLIDMLLEAVGNVNATFGELYKKFDYHCDDSDVELYAQKYALLELYYSLHGYDENTAVKDFVHGINSWESFLINRVCHMLERDNPVVISPQQRDILTKYCYKQIELIDFEKDIQNSDNNTITYHYRIMYVAFLSQYLNLPYDKNHLLKMTVIPKYFWGDSEHKPDQPFSKFISKHLSNRELIEQVRINLENGILCKDSFEEHVRFCKLNHLDFAIPSAEEICLDTSNSEFFKREMADYIYKIKGIDYLYNRFLNTDDMVLFKIIADITIKEKDCRLKNRLEEIFDTADNGKDYLNYLLQLNSLKGLEHFYRTAYAEMRSTRIETNSYDQTIELISGMSDPSLLDCFDRLRTLVHTEGFKDLEDFGLGNSVYRAYKNIASNDYDAVKYHLELALENTDISTEEKGFCNSILSEIEYTHNSSCDKTWNLREVREFWYLYDNKWYL